MSQVLEIGNPFLNEVAWNGIHLHAQQILYLCGEDGDSDTAGETNDDGVGNVLDDSTQAQQAETDKENTRHECGDGETLYAILVDDASHDDNKSTRRTANLYFRTAKGRNGETCYDSRDNTFFWRNTTGNTEGDSQWKGNDTHDKTGHQVGCECLFVVIPNSRYQFRLKI